MNIFPAIDLRDGRCVRLYQGDYERETRYDEDPTALAFRYGASGVEWLHVVDLDGARTGRSANLESIAQIVGLSGCAVQAGGGIREQEDIQRLFDVGVSRVVIGSVAMQQPQLARDWMAHYGAERICLALDVRHVDDDWRLAATGWTETQVRTLWLALEDFPDLCHVLCTDIGRDGTLEGPNDALYDDLLARYPGLRLQASGGVSSLEDLRRLSKSGAEAVIVGRALLEGRFTIEEAVACLQDA